MISARTVQSGAAGEALDFLAAMIRDSAAQRPTTVCWVFDQSVSLAGQRREIASRIERVLAHVTDALWDTEHHAVEHTVFAYAQTVTRVTPEPTIVAADVMGAIEMIAIEDSGIENTFTAIREAVRNAAKPASRRLGKNICVIVFTDERGNDEDLADSVARLCIAQLAPVYVVGVHANRRTDGHVPETAPMARLDAYNTTLATAKRGLRFQNPQNDTWELEPSDDVSQSGSAIEKLARQARDVLTQVVAERPGTPWALIAAAELEAPIGYAWKKSCTNARPPPPPNGGGPVGKPADDVVRPRMEPPKPPRPVRNL